jgi:hypothetical protein
VRLTVRGALRRRFAARRRVALALEAADVLRTPLRIVARVRLVGVGRGG